MNFIVTSSGLRAFATILILASVGSCAASDQAKGYRVLHQDHELKIAYSDDWLYHGAFGRREPTSEELKTEAYQRVPSTNPACRDYGHLSWITNSSADPICGGYRIKVVRQLNDSTYWADVWLVGDEPDVYPFIRIFVNDGELGCLRFNYPNGTHQEYFDTNAPEGCDF